LIGTEILDTPVYELDAFVEDSGKPIEGAAPLVVAYGVALGLLGGGELRAALRREELRYTGAFERLELPIAVLIMLLVMGLSVFNIFEHRRLEAADGNLYLWLASNKNYLINDPKQGKRGYLEKPWPEIQKYVTEAALEDGEKPEGSLTRGVSKLDQLLEVERQLKVREAKLNQELGNTGEVTQPQSALEALTMIVCTIDGMRDRLGKVSVRKASADYRPGRGGRAEEVEVKLDLTFFGENATVAYEALNTELRNQPWVTSVESRSNTELKAESPRPGVFADDYTIHVDLSKIERKKEGS
jgi:hypothetical protein